MLRTPSCAQRKKITLLLAVNWRINWPYLMSMGNWASWFASRIFLRASRSYEYIQLEPASRPKLIKTLHVTLKIWIFGWWTKKWQVMLQSWETLLLTNDVVIWTYKAVSTSIFKFSKPSILNTGRFSMERRGVDNGWT